MTDLALGKYLGMSYHEIRALPVAVYAVALEDLMAYTNRLEHAREAVEV